jgi:hypothetical protein
MQKAALSRLSNVSPIALGADQQGALRGLEVVAKAPLPEHGKVDKPALSAGQRQARAMVITRRAAIVPATSPELAAKHARNAEQIAELGVEYTSRLILPDPMPERLAAMIGARVRQAKIAGTLEVEQLKNIQRGEIADVDVKHVSAEVGAGVFARSPIAKGAFLGEYAGELRFLMPSQMFAFAEGNPYAFELSGELPWKRGMAMVDSRERGNFTRFLNHSYRPNLDVQQVLTKDGYHTIFLALRDIEPGEQLMFNYGRHYWKGRGRPEAIAPS